MKKQLIFDLLTVSCLSATGQAYAQEKRPNILFIMSDDHASQAISCYGKQPLCDVLSTPNINRIGNEGVRLNNCFATNSISTPSRAAILTGQYSQCNGVYTLNDELNPALPTMVKELSQSGYQTAIVGKWHLASEPAYFDYYNVLPGQGRYQNPILLEKGKWTGANFKQAEGEVHQGHSTDVIADEAMKWLSGTDKNEPFFLMCHFKAPHRSWEPADRFKSLFEGVTIPEPDNLLDNYAGKGSNIKDLKMMLENMNKTDLKTTLPQGLSTDEFRHWAYQLYIKDYLRCIAGVDENVGRILEYLEDNDLLENTIVVYTADQGFFLGEHGFFDKRLMYEESIRMPFLIRYPKMIQVGKTNDDVILNIDIAPTLLNLAGVSTPEYMQGRSFMPNLQGNTPGDWRSSMYYRYWMHADGSHNVPSHYGIRDSRYKLIFYYGQPLGMKGAGANSITPVWEFYDMQTDPMEMNNLYGNAGYREIIDQMKSDLLDLKKQYKDEDSDYPQMKAVVDGYYWNDARFLYDAPKLVLTDNSITDSLRTITLDEMPNVYPANKTQLINPTLMTERAWRLALRDAESNIVTSSNGKKYFGAGKTFGMTVYTRDISYSGVLGLNMLYPEIMKSSLEYSRDVRLGLGLLVPVGQTVPEIPGNWVEDTTPGTFLNKYKTHPFTRRTDDVVWVWAAYDLFDKNPELADWQWLYDKITDSFSILYNPFFDASDGLYHGQASFIDIHNVDSKTTGYPQDYSVNDCILVKATSTNSLYYMAHKCMADVCEKLGKTAEAAEWRTKAQALRTAMLSNLRFADGSFSYYKDKNGVLQPRREALGAALAVITGVVEGEDALKCLAGYPVSWAGVQLLYPFFPDITGVYHNNTAWPFVDTFFLWAKEMAEGTDYTSQSAAMLTRCTYGGSFREIVNWNTKEPARSQSQLWTAAGYINVCLRAGIVGEIIPPAAEDDADPENVWFDIDFSTDEWLDAFSAVMQASGKDPYDPRTCVSGFALETGGVNSPITVNGLTFNTPFWRDAASFTSLCGKTFEYSVRLRANQNNLSYIEFPVVENAGKLVLYAAHGRDANEPNTGNIFLEVGRKENANGENDVTGEWKTIYTWDVTWDGVPNTDVRLSYDIELNEPVALRVQRQKGTFLRIYRVALGKYSEEGNSVQSARSDAVDFQVINRSIRLSESVTGGEIRIYDISGRQVLKRNIHSDTVPIDDMKPGVYIVKLICGQAGKTKKVLLVSGAVHEERELRRLCELTQNNKLLASI
ncbi:MAG: sulfatase-like hydrolase/transferase [Prevotella sp.]|jgi:arylsulfatase A-like enzyme|nr:sulfatase-like hydrolase/transferase [Prevotella sp.]